MVDAASSRVAVYLDFDNIVTGRYDALHGKGSFRDDKIRYMNVGWSRSDPQTVAKATAANINLGAIIDFAGAHGPISIARAYADWRMAVNGSYVKALRKMAVSEVQVSPSGAGTKNGADIRLTIDVMEDVLGGSDVTHIVIVAGDSDYVPLIRRARELGKTVIGIGVAGSVSESLRDSCDTFVPYEELPGVGGAARGLGRHSAKIPDDAPRAIAAPVAVAPAKGANANGNGTKAVASAAEQRAATRLLLDNLPPAPPSGHGAWIACSALKNLMLAAQPDFSEKLLGYKSFTAFVESRAGQVEFSSTSNGRARVRPGA